ncbi:homeobox protein 2 isoform X3 [Tribolium castaneum]|nr:PREDICTED: homeobox protein 2 isoform X3 [Tribolium castaneum]|eukprot:XP_008193672.1 PREDICTED: homeobox protein 2 isoform X3 [Tribolium castaneum]
MGDDDLLGGDSDCEPYDFSEEKEELLLQGDDDYSKTEAVYKKASNSDSDDQDDVLNLDIEEDFQDVDDKLLFEEEQEPKVKKDEKFSSEKKPQNTQHIPVVKTHPIAPKKQDNVAPPKERSAPKVLTRNDNRWRNPGRGNSQQRPNYAKNNFQRRRNGTVLINPRYEGTVRVSENTRLAWDNNAQYPQNNTSNYVQPWVSGNNLNYETTPQNQIFNNLAALLPQTSNSIFQPPVNSYQPTLSFEPPPGIQTSPPPYNTQVQPYCQWNSPSVDNQVSRGQYAAQSSTSSHQPCLPRGPQNFNNSYTNYYNSSFNLQNYSSYNVRPNYETRRKPYNNMPSQNTNFQNKNSSYASNNSYNRNTNLSSVPKRPNYSSPHIVPIENRNQFNETRANSYRNDFKQGQNQNVQSGQQFQTRTENRPNNTTFKKNNDNFDVQRNRRTNDNSGAKSDQPEKRPKFDESSNKKSADSTKESKNEDKKVPPDENIDFEDEETRLYRLKIEEQKRERERILALKEERRKQMMLQRKQEEAKKLPPPPPPPQPENSANFSKPANFQRPQFERVADTATVQNQYAKPKNSAQYSNVDSDLSDEFPNLTFKITNKIPQSAPVQSTPKTEASSSGFMSNRVVMVKGKTGGLPVSSTGAPKPSNEVNESSNVGQGLSAFFNNRKVLKKDSSLLDTRLVVVNNLSANINQNKLVALTRGIGEVQKLRVDRQERQATILFKSVASAHAFFKKYQRRILDDLSVIEVKLEPMI